VKFNHVCIKFKQSATTAFPIANLATPAQIAEQLQVTPQCVNSWHRSRLIPARVDEGRIVRFHLPEVLDALNQLDPKKHCGSIPLRHLENDFEWLTPTSQLAFDKDLPQRITWQIDDECGPSAWVFTPAPRLQTISEIADVIQTTRQTVNMWLSQGIIPAHVSSENVVRLDLEEVLDVLQKRADWKRNVLMTAIRSPQKNETTPRSVILRQKSPCG